MRERKKAKSFLRDHIFGHDFLFIILENPENFGKNQRHLSILKIFVEVKLMQSFERLTLARYQSF